MAHCCKCGKICDTDYKTSEGYYVCEACWENQPSAADIVLVPFIRSLFVRVILPVLGIAAIWFALAAIVVYGPEKLGLPNEWCLYIWLGASTMLSIPLVIIVLKGLWVTWCVTHWILKTFFCVCCPPLIILAVIHWLIKRSHKR